MAVSKSTKIFSFRIVTLLMLARGVTAFEINFSSYCEEKLMGQTTTIEHDYGRIFFRCCCLRGSSSCMLIKCDTFPEICEEHCPQNQEQDPDSFEPIIDAISAYSCNDSNVGESRAFDLRPFSIESFMFVCHMHDEVGFYWHNAYIIEDHYLLFH